MTSSDRGRRDADASGRGHRRGGAARARDDLEVRRLARPLRGREGGRAVRRRRARQVLAAYRRALEPYREEFRPGPTWARPRPTSPRGWTAPPPLGQSHEGVDMDDLATGHGVKAAAEAALAHGGRALTGAAIAIEGFGKVGPGWRSPPRARRPDRRREHGRRAARRSGRPRRRRAVLVARAVRRRARRARAGARPPARGAVRPGCDVLVPGARPDSITREVAARLRCAVVAPGANVPYGPGAVDELDRRGIVAVPDFIANAAASTSTPGSARAPPRRRR